MSHRWLLFKLDVCPNYLHKSGVLQCFADGETGTWRFLVDLDTGGADLNFEMVKKLYRFLGEAIATAESDPDKNPELIAQSSRR